jgi:site-specific recombinase XerD
MPAKSNLRLVKPAIQKRAVGPLRRPNSEFRSREHLTENGKPSTHPIRGDELRALRKLKREAPKSPFVFVSERGGPFTTDSFNWLVKRAGKKARFPFQAHAHMLRHAAGHKLAGDGHDTRSIQDYLGHKNIQHTVRYTELSPTRFKDFWRD